MNIQYEEKVIEYDSLKEMSDQVILMQEQGWRAVRHKETTDYVITYKKGQK